METIKPYSKAIERFSDDGIYYFGAYGPRIVDQLTYIVDTLLKDPNSRQAVLTIWRDNPRDSRDIPCTVSIQWVIRDNKLHCFDTMRSSDVWLGWVYDIFNFSCLSKYIIEMLKIRGSKVTVFGTDTEEEKQYNQFENLTLGDLILTAGSQHLYEENYEKAKEVCGTFKHENGVLYPVADFDILDVSVGPLDDVPRIIPYLNWLKDHNGLPITWGGPLDELFNKTYCKEQV